MAQTTRKRSPRARLGLALQRLIAIGDDPTNPNQHAAMLGVLMIVTLVIVAFVASIVLAFVLFGPWGGIIWFLGLGALGARNLYRNVTHDE